MRNPEGGTLKLPKYCKITVYYNNGDIEKFYGGLHADEKLLKIRPADSGRTINIPLVCIRKYIAAN